MRKTLEEFPEILTVEEAAEYLRVSRAMCYQLARQYRSPAAPTGYRSLKSDGVCAYLGGSWPGS